MLRDLLNHLLTESDNTTHDLFRYIALASVVVGLVLQVYVVTDKGHPFDMTTFGTGVGALLAGAGVALGLKPESKTKKGGDDVV